MTEPVSNPRFRLALIPLFSVLGASAAIYLAKHYYELQAGTAGFKSLCNINATMNCDAVTASRFAEVMPGLPLSSFVAGWFVALLILGVMARVSDWRREAILVGTLMAGFGSLYSIALLAIMAFVIHKFCLFCLSIDAVNFVLLGIFFSLLPRGKSQSVFGGARWSKIQSNALIVLGAVVVTVVILRPSTDGQPDAAQIKSDEEYALNQISQRPPVEVRAPAGAAVLGDPNAPITIYEFSDFQCPFCKRGAVMMNQLLSRYEGKIKLVFMPFPLDNSCNRIITRPMHPYSCELARSAFCAQKAGNFKSAYEKIFEDQEFLTANSAKKIAADFANDPSGTCLESEDAKTAVSESIEEGLRLKVEATPTFFINGKMVDVALPIDGWDRLITSAAAATK